MVEYLSKKEFREEIKLNDEYNAIVTADGVKVGCQGFTFEAIEGLYESVQRAKKEKSKVDYFVTQDPMEACQNVAWAVKGGLVYSTQVNTDGKIHTHSEPSRGLTLETVQRDLASGKRIKMTEDEFLARAKKFLNR